MFVIVIPLILKAAGYQLEPGWKVAELAFERRDISMCDDIIAYDLFLGPPTEVQKAVCIRNYAKLAEDPTACRKIMPSGYGLNCINQSIGNLFRDNSKAESIDINADCSAYASNPIRKDNCFFSKAHISKDLNLCNKIINSVMQTACNEKIGAWYQYPELRTSIYFGKYREEN